MTCGTGTEADQALALICSPGEPGKPSQGFAASTVHQLSGATVYRRTDPHYPSKAHGLEYVSWEATGPHAQLLAAPLSPGSTRASRADLAFDFQVPEDFSADEFADQLLDFHEAQGIVSGISGQGRVNTRYIGAASSDRRIRIYRKDLKDPELIATHGAVLRVELILRRKCAAPFFDRYLEDPAQAVEIAAAHIEQMTGWKPTSGPAVEIPPIEQSVIPDASQEVFQFVKQNGQQLEAFRAAGIDLNRLADDYGRPPKQTRMQQKRRRDRIDRIVACGVSEVIEGVETLLTGFWRRKGAI